MTRAAHARRTRADARPHAAPLRHRPDRSMARRREPGVEHAQRVRDRSDDGPAVANRPARRHPDARLGPVHAVRTDIGNDSRYGSRYRESFPISIQRRFIAAASVTSSRSASRSPAREPDTSSRSRRRIERVPSAGDPARGSRSNSPNSATAEANGKCTGRASAPTATGVRDQAGCVAFRLLIPHLHGQPLATTSRRRRATGRRGVRRA